MAELNWGILNPKIAGDASDSYYQGQQQASQNALAQAQLQHAQGQNALAKYSLAQAQRADARQDAYNQAWQNVDVSNPDAIRSALPGLMKADPTAGLGLMKQLDERDKTQAGIGKDKADTAKMQQEVLKHQYEIAGQLAAGWVKDPGVSKERIGSGIQSAGAMGVIPKEMVQAKLAELDGVPEDPSSLQNWAKATLMQSMPAHEALKYITPDMNTQLHNQTLSSNNAATVGAAMYGHNVAAGNAQLADNRAREFNDLKRAEAESGRTPIGYRKTPSGDLEVIPGGPAMKDKAPTEFQGKAAQFGTRAAESDKILNQIGTNYSPAGLALTNKLGDTWVAGGALRAAGNKLSSDNTQKADQAQRDFVNAVLRLESGAAISQSEFDNARQQYFPQPGDSPAKVAQKARNRAIEVEGLKHSAGPGAYETKVPAASVAPQKDASSTSALPDIGTVINIKR